MPSTAALLAQYAVSERLRIAPAAEIRTAAAGVRSYLADGRGVAWLVPDEVLFRAAIDAELAAQPVSDRLSRRANSTDPAVVWPRWTRCEVVAKLLDLPVLSWLGWPELNVPEDLADQVVTVQVRIGDVLVCCGLRIGS